MEEVTHSFPFNLAIHAGQISQQNITTRIDVIATWL